MGLGVTGELEKARLNYSVVDHDGFKSVRFILFMSGLEALGLLMTNSTHSSVNNTISLRPHTHIPSLSVTKNLDDNVALCQGKRDEFLRSI